MSEADFAQPSVRGNSRRLGFQSFPEAIFRGMKAYVLQHVPFEGPGKIAEILARRGAEVKTVKVYEGDPMPSLDDAGFVALMGGPMSVLDEDEFPAFKAEKGFCRELVRRGTPALGVCLGAQMLAHALGARIVQNPEKEIGWLPIEFTESGKTETVFHWHGQTFDLPSGAIHLAKSVACKNQAFKVGGAYAIQFHIETTPQALDDILKNCGDELVPGHKYIQSEQEIRALASRHMTRANELLEGLMRKILGE